MCLLAALIGSLQSLVGLLFVVLTFPVPALPCTLKVSLSQACSFLFLRKIPPDLKWSSSLTDSWQKLLSMLLCRGVLKEKILTRKQI